MPTHRARPASLRLHAYVVAVLASAFCACIPPAGVPSQPVAYVHGDALVWLDAAGRDRVLAEPTPPDRPASEPRWVYRTPHVSPDARRVVCVRFEARGWRPRYQVVVVRPESGEIRLLHESKARLHSPVWSSEGQRVAFLEGSHGLRLWEEGRGVVAAPVADHPSEPRTGEPRAIQRIAWLQGGDRLAVACGGRRGELGTIDLAGSSPGYRRGLDLSRGLPLGEAWAGAQTGPVLRALYGDPRLLAHYQEARGLVQWTSDQLPYATADNRYFIYKVKREGVSASGWVESFDRRTGQRRTLKRLWWAPYTE